MKIHSLDIKNIRGIPDLRIVPSNKSLVIYGPNGSGKSAVIDALDFLLTGRIARLVGEGTDGVTLKSHGPHIDKVADLSKVEVCAEIKIANVSELISISRKMNQASILVYDKKYQTQLAPVIELLDRGQHVFTRRELLKLITAKASTRAQEIQKILKLEDLEAIRKNLRSVFNEAKKEYNAATIRLETFKKEILVITGLPTYIASETLGYVNKQRKILGAKELTELDSTDLQKDIAPIQSNVKSVNHEQLVMRVNSLKQTELVDMFAESKKYDEELRTILKEIRDDTEAKWDSSRHQLTIDGIALIRDSGECPLCDVEWKNEELKEYLEQRIETQKERQNKLKKHANGISENANSIILKIGQLTELTFSVKDTKRAMSSEIFKDCTNTLSEWKIKLGQLKTALVKPLDTYMEEKFDPSEIELLFSPTLIDTTLNQFETELKKLFPEATPEQTAWDNLTKLKERIKLVEDGELEVAKTSLVFNRITVLGKAYVNARDAVLDNLYDKIKNRFVGLYREMHGTDEKDFEASFTPKDAGLNLEVDFYGRGQHPPHAMHSEGHQDSMGVCLFLALSEHLNKGLIDLTILDDIVMSVDTGHRRAFCDVLANNFSDCQFIITTHDTMWANQLKSAGIVPGKQMLKFSNWDVDEGPDVHYEADMWGRIQKDLDNDDVPAAAAKLRRGMEEFSRYVCHSLKASVPYNIDDAGSLGDFMPSAIGRYSDLLKAAIKSSESWGKTKITEELKQIDTNRISIVQRTNAEQWNVNKAVHFNEWANLQKDDFVQVVEAFKDLYEQVFSCSNPSCQSVLQVTFNGATKTGVRCKCGDTNWNLVKK